MLTVTAMSVLGVIDVERAGMERDGINECLDAPGEVVGVTVHCLQVAPGEEK